MRVIRAAIGVSIFLTWHFRGNAIDLSRAMVVTPRGLASTEKKAVTMLIDEVEKRTGVRWRSTTTWPSPATTSIVLGSASSLRGLAGINAAALLQDGEFNAREGYRIRIRQDPETSVVFVIGNDSRGLLFGIGRLLRALRMSPNSITLDADFQVTTAPKYSLRGHQLGYRPKTNSYDAWDLATWEQYIRDLIVFGCNAIELVPPRSDDAADSPHFPLPPMEMMIGMSRLANEYGLDVWIWYPALDQDYSDPKTVEFALKEWSEVFQKLPRIDAVFVPGGDPGHTPPQHLMALLEKQTQNLHRSHPQAQMWVSPQGFDQGWLDEFVGLLEHQQPAWLSGVVFGPQIRVSLPQLRAMVPQKYPIRHYPDITHSRQCQYPVPDWDVAYAVTEGRECINPRPNGEAAIFRLLQPLTVGFLTYSEGCNDDVNKTVWSALGWDPDANVVDILREYGHYFIGESLVEGFAQGLLALERNWQGSLLANEGVSTTLAQFQSLEKAASTGELRNWRFQQALYRAYYDAYTRSRLLYETELEDRAMEQLRQARNKGSLAALTEAEDILERAVNEPVAKDWHARIFELAEALYQSIGMQLSVPKYKAIAVDRGANLDTLDFPLNNRLWLKAGFRELRKLPGEPERLAGIDEILQWTDPGPGGFYDDLGNASRQPHLVRGLGFEQDPGSLASPRVGFDEEKLVDEPEARSGSVRRVSWLDHAESLFDAPLSLRYTNLNPSALYKIRVVYAGDSPKRKIRLVANDQIQIHSFIVKELPFRPREFDIPAAATRTGELTLSWFREPGSGGNGRGCQVSEVWLIKK
jgi:hypothetical protein